MEAPNLTPVKNPSPQETFRFSKDNVSLHRTMVDSGPFERGIHFALLQFQHDVAAQVKDGNSAAAVGYKLQGALEFVAILRNLAESTPPIQRIAQRGLDHRA